MIAEVATNLLGEIVEICERDGYSSNDFRLRGRGHVRAVYVADKALMVLVEHDLGWDSQSHNDRTKDGGLEMYSLGNGRARVVQRCGICGAWDQKMTLMAVYSGEGLEKAWEHRAGEGCKKVGQGG